MTTLVAQMTQEELTQMIENVIERKFMVLFNLAETVKSTVDEPLLHQNDGTFIRQKKVFKGHFWQVDFQHSNRHVKLHVSNSNYIKCTFDDTLAAKVQEAMQHNVRVWGLATIEPITNEIQELELKGLTILDVPQEVESTPKTFAEVKSYILTKNFELHRRLANS